VLRPIQNIFDPADYPNLLIGLEGPDDAAVWQLDEKRVLVVTTDFFTPVVDDAYDYGSIAAANSLSDIYAMGGTPFLALNIAALPPDLPTEISSEIMRGGAEKSKEAGVVIAGGHTIQDNEPKYGLVVLGFADKDKMLAKASLHPGDALVLTKPLGFGCTTTALKQGKADEVDIREVVGWMQRLNRTSSLLAVEFGLSSATDITGFSLLGHAMEMADASGVALNIDYTKLPFVSGARKYAKMFTFPGGASDNRLYFGPRVEFASSIDEAGQMLLFDPQTSGGLLMGVPQEKLSAFEVRAKEQEQSIWVIGEAREGSGISVNG
jgi:selenide,water dikinase